MSKLNDILSDVDWAEERLEGPIRDLILSQGWYYYDPDELGEDAFKRLTADEVNDL